MSDPKIEKKKQALAIRRKYDAKERRRNRVLWALFIGVLLIFAGALIYGLSKPGPGGDPWNMPFIGERHRQLKENNPDH